MNGCSSQQAWQRMIPHAECTPRRLGVSDPHSDSVTGSHYTDRYHFSGSVAQAVELHTLISRPRP